MEKLHPDLTQDAIAETLLLAVPYVRLMPGKKIILGDQGC